MSERAWVCRVECRDCGGGQDPLGCFDGGYDDTEFSTEAEARAEAKRVEATGAPWDAEVFERQT